MDVTTFAAVVGGYFGLAALPKADLAAIYSPLFLPYTTEAAAAAGSAFSTFKDFTSQQLLFAQLGGAALTQGDSLLESSLFLATVQQLQDGGAVIPIPQTYIDNDDGKYWIEPFLYNLNVWAPANYLGFAAQYNLQAGGNYKSGVYLSLAQTGALINILTTYTSSAFGLIGAASYPLSKAGEQIGNLVTAGLTADAVGYTNSVTPACGMGPPTTAAAVQSAIITILVAGDFGSTACRDAIIGTGSGTALIGFMAAIKTALTNANNQWTAWGLNLSSLGPTTTAPDAMASSTFRIAFHALMLVDYFQKNFFLITGEFLTGDQRNDGLIIHRSALEIMSGAHYAIAPGGTAAGFLWNSFRTPYSPTADLNKYSRGIADINTVNTYVEYEGATQLAANYFPRMTAEKPELRNIRGFDYTQFVPAEKTVIMVDVDKPRYNHYDVFLEPASRTFRLFYQNKDDDILGVKCNRFAVSTDELTLETGNFGNNKYYGSSFDGAQYGGNTNPFHSFVSRPYYLYGNDIYDLYPDFETEASPSKHETTICIEPLTGATVDGSLNFMGSLGLDKTGFTASSRFAFGYDLNSTYLIDQSQMYDDTNPVLQPPLPLYWYTQTATLNEATADALKSSLYGATKGAYAALIVGIVLGSILVIVGIVLLVLHKKEGGLGKTESTAEMLKSPAFAPEVNNPTYER
ncbi:hypothetical protein CAOG_001241 [Capsaspora owczarzaki ATCC 30864]|uniref:Uncharacterized protein n=2 Tax=Capsaspora owczarzaki (strain ATCC 30864) TaxID=595528 RepID=A0A0D2WIT5_CAPO3|nr:hypothetical protein CAOG_001241 [Capsaspora owczarzaki ATCC 30864]